MFEQWCKLFYEQLYEAGHDMCILTKSSLIFHLVYVWSGALLVWLYSLYYEWSIVTGPAKINHMSAKNCRFFSFLLYHNLWTIYSTKIKSLSLLQNHSNNHNTFGKGWLASWIFHITCTRIMSITKAAECKVGRKTHSTALKLARGSRRMLPKKIQNLPSWGWIWK